MGPAEPPGVVPGVLRVRPPGPPRLQPGCEGAARGCGCGGAARGTSRPGLGRPKPATPQHPGKAPGPPAQGAGPGGRSRVPSVANPTRRRSGGDALLRLHPRASRSSSALCTARFEFAAYSQAGGTSRPPQQHFGVGIVPSEFEDLPRE